MQNGFEDRQILVLVTAKRPGPTANTAEKMQPLGCHSHFDFDSLRQGLRKPLATLQNHGIGYRPLRTDDIKGNLADLYEAIVLEGRTILGILWSQIHPLGRVDCESRGQIEYAEALLVRADESEQIVQSFSAQRLEPFGHQRQPGRTPAFDVVFADGEIAGRIAQDKLSLVLSRNDPVVAQLVPGLDAGAVEVGFDLAVWINNMNQQVGHAMRPHAGQIRRHVPSFILERVADSAICREQLVPVFQVPSALLHHRAQLRDQYVLLFLFGPADGVEDRVCFGGDRAVRVGPEPMDICRPNEP